MKKSISPVFAILIVVVALALCGLIYSRIPLTPQAPPVKKGENRPPPGTRLAKMKPPSATQSKDADGATKDKRGDNTDQKADGADKKTDGPEKNGDGLDEKTDTTGRPSQK